MSCRGGEKHQKLVDIVRSIDWGDLRIIIDDWFMSFLLGFTSDSGDGRSGVLFPDFIIVNSVGDVVVGEVGKTHPDKWPSNYPIVHIGFNRRVRTIVSSGYGNMEMVYLVAGLISATLGYSPGADTVDGRLHILNAKSYDSRTEIIMKMLCSGFNMSEIVGSGESILTAKDNINKGNPLGRAGMKYLVKKHAKLWRG